MKREGIYFTSYPLSQILSRNPYSENGYYGENWVIVNLPDTMQEQTATDREHAMQTGARIHTIPRDRDFWCFRLMDLINYHQLYGRNILIIGKESYLQRAANIYGNSTIRNLFRREYEPEFLVHSTSRESGEIIIKEGKIRCWNQLRDEGKIQEEIPIGHLIRDTVDVSDYVMLSGRDMDGELVVLSKQRGEILLDPKADYIPGFRFYFSTHQLAQQGMLIRDGIHYKVKGELDLKYCLYIAKAKEILRDLTAYTPEEFTKAANRSFYITQCMGIKKALRYF